MLWSVHWRFILDDNKVFFIFFFIFDLKTFDFWSSYHRYCFLVEMEIIGVCLFENLWWCFLELTFSLESLGKFWNDFIDHYAVTVVWNICFHYIQSDWLDIGNCVEIQLKNSSSLSLIQYACWQCYSPFISNLGIRIFFYFQIREIDPLSIHF